MLNIQVDSGLQEISLNGAVSVWLNLTDSNFIEKMFSAFAEMDKMQEGYQKALTGAEDAEVFKVARTMDTEMREKINDVFGVDVCTPLFGDVNVYAIANGLPLWANLMLAMIDEMDTTITSEKKKTNPRLKKYTEKYKR